VLQNHLRSRISKGAPTSPFEASLGEREAALVNKTRSRYIFENRILNASGFQRRDSRRKHPGRREKGPRLKTGTSKPHIKQGPDQALDGQSRDALMLSGLQRRARLQMFLYCPYLVSEQREYDPVTVTLRRSRA